MAEERAEHAAARAAAARARALKAECRVRILDLFNDSAQASTAQAGVIYASMRTDGADASTARDAVGIAEGDLTTATEWKARAGARQTKCRRAIADGEDPVWPDVPAGVSERAARF